MSVNKSVTVPVGSGFLSVTLQASQIALACVGAQFPTQGRGKLSVVLRTPRALFRGPLVSSGGPIRFSLPPDADPRDHSASQLGSSHSRFHANAIASPRNLPRLLLLVLSRRVQASPGYARMDAKAAL